MTMRNAKHLLELLTIAHQPFMGAKHAVTLADGKLHVILAWAPGDFKHFTLEDEDLDRPPMDIFVDIESLLTSTTRRRSAQVMLGPLSKDNPLSVGLSRALDPENSLSRDEKEVLHHLRTDVSSPTSILSLSHWTGRTPDNVQTILTNLITKGLAEREGEGAWSKFKPSKKKKD